MQQGHVSGPFDRQFILAVVMNHVGNGGVRLTELAQNVFVVLAHDLHVHKPFGAA